MTAAHYKGGHPPGNDLGLHYTALPPIVASCPYSDQLLVTRKFWSPGANRPSQVRNPRAGRALPVPASRGSWQTPDVGASRLLQHECWLRRIHLRQMTTPIAAQRPNVMSSMWIATSTGSRTGRLSRPREEKSKMSTFGTAVWKGGIRDGKGAVSTKSGAF